MHHMHRTMALALFLTSFAVLPARADEAAPPAGSGVAPLPAPDAGKATMNLKAAAAKTGVLTHMIAATKLAGLDRDDIKIGPLTLFAPTDCAFNALAPDIRTKLLAPENVGLLTRVLMHHAVVGEYPTDRLLRAKTKNYMISAVDQTELEIYVGARGLDVDEGRIIRGDIIATDGIIHLIDRVLIPADVMADLNGTPALGDKVTEAPAPASGCCAAAAPGETGSISRP